MQFDGVRFTFGRPVNLTDQPCYDNQPFFLPDSSGFLYTSNRDGQTDVYRYDLARGSTHRVTATPESEYSPTVIPDRTAFTVVRVEADGTQRLWRFPLEGGAPTLLLPGIAPVGYHAWGFRDTLGLFVLGDPPVLHVADAGTGRGRVVTENIGRSLNKIPPAARRSASSTRATPTGGTSTATTCRPATSTPLPPRSRAGNSTPGCPTARRC